MSQARPELRQWSARQVALVTLFVVLVVLSFWLIYRFRIVLIILILAVVFGTAIRPAVDWLHARGLGRALSVITIYLLLLLFLVALIVLLTPLITRQASDIAARAPELYRGLLQWMQESGNRLLQRLGSELATRLSAGAPPPPPAADGEIVPIEPLAQSVVIAGLLTRGIAATIAVFVLGFYWTLESERTLRYALLLLPVERRERTREIINDVETSVGGYVRAQSILCLAIGLAALIAYLLIGLPYAIVLAVLAGILEAVPLVGPVLGAVPAVLVALSTNPAQVLWVIGAAVLIQMLENYILVPRVMRRVVGINPLVTLLALTAFGSLFGLVGALLAVPLTAILQLLLNRFVLEPEPNGQQAVSGRDYASVLRYEAQAIAQDARRQVKASENAEDDGPDQVHEIVEALALDLDRILADENGEGQAAEEGAA